MFLVISHSVEDGVTPGPLGATPLEAIEAWKETRLVAYEESGDRDPDWDPDQPDSYDGMIIDMASDLRGQVATSTSAFAHGEAEQAYLVEVPAMPEQMVGPSRSIMRLSNHRGTRYYVYERNLRVPVASPVSGLTTSSMIADFDTEAEARAAFPAAQLGYQKQEAA